MLGKIFVGVIIGILAGIFTAKELRVIENTRNIIMGLFPENVQSNWMD